MDRQLISQLLDKLSPRRRALRVPVIRSWRNRARAVRISAFRPASDLPDAAVSLVSGVRADGAHAVPMAHLFGPDSSILSLIHANLPVISALAEDGIVEANEVFEHIPELYLLGLDQILLKMAEMYLEEPCYYLGATLKRERANGATGGARQWHMDIEDDRMLRFIVYLCNVDEDTGPFSFVPFSESAAVHERTRYRSGYMHDEAFAEAVSPASQRKITGSFGTVLAFDGTRIFHRAQPPAHRERLSLSITYCSRYPRHIFQAARLTRASRRRLLTILAEDQRKCIPPARWS